MNKKLENIAIKGVGKGSVVSFLESQGGINNWMHKDKNTYDAFYIDEKAEIIKTLHPEHFCSQLTLKQAQELVNPKPELTFPRKMLVGITKDDINHERIILFEKNGLFAGIVSLHGKHYNNPVSEMRFEGFYWPFAKEIPTQQEINQEKIKNLQDNLNKLIEQECDLRRQINILKP